MTAARYVFSSLVAVVCLAGLFRAAAAGTTPAGATAAAGPATTPAPSTVMKNLKKVLAAVDPNGVADSVSRFVYCASHHYKALESGVAPHAAEWATCNKQPSNLQGNVACFIKNPNSLLNFVLLGQQIGDMVGCLLMTSEKNVLCVKKVQKTDDCASMCPEARSAWSNSTFAIVSPALPPTVRKDDCKLTGKGLTTPGSSILPTALDITFKLMQCMPTHFGDMYQSLMEQVKIINQCTQGHDNWTSWSKCVLEAQDGNVLASYLVKLRLTAVCVLGGDMPAQTLCVRAVPTTAECRACGGMDTTTLEPAIVLGPTAQCAP
ncbi:uncharacterized protein LOC113214803 [Frankliniella occidentalis]|uniref:Uncharacterized protein LOC113214803 n=1 Tax=Frankliniella occidentalis TaxID=133901 RepID=A0A6J1TEC1_FRAOC|nr:uncharacterized protein LOC113214803 [Frankliniella occidentalis]